MKQLMFDAPPGITQDIFTSDKTFIYECKIDSLNTVKSYEFLMRAVYYFTDLDEKAIEKFDKFIDKIYNEDVKEKFYVTKDYGNYIPESEENDNTYTMYRIHFNISCAEFVRFRYVYKRYKTNFYEKLKEESLANTDYFVSMVNVLDIVAYGAIEDLRLRKED